MVSKTEEQPLLTPVQVGRYRLPNRVVMAPLTRCRADNPERAPTELHARYYAQRASAGLIVTEATQISPQGIGYPHTPGIHSPAQIGGWRRVTEAVHEQGGHILLQLWHVGRVSHPDFHGGELPVAPSAIKPTGQAFTAAGLKDFVTPRALETHEVKAIVEDFVQGARNAIAAGFDGVEVHGANGYLIEQFLRDSSNRRRDEYGGSVANRGRFLFEIVDRVSAAIGSDRVGVRLSPGGTAYCPPDSDTQALYDFVIGVLDNERLAYLHLREADAEVADTPNMVTNVSEHYRTVYHGTLMANTGYDREKGNAAIADGIADVVAYGVPWIANPDLVSCFRKRAALARADRDTFYQGGARGYVDYPRLCAEAA